MTEKPSARLFIAVELPALVKKELGKLQQQLGQQPDDAIKWVAPDSIHLTLKFLGNTPTDTVGEIAATLNLAVEGFTPFKVRLYGSGAFPNVQRPVVAWCGLGGSTDHLMRLQQAVEAAVSPLGFPAEKRPYSPHLTLARLKDYTPALSRQSLSRRLITQSQYEGPWFEVKKVSLMQSRLTPSGPVYSRLAGCDLTG